MTRSWLAEHALLPAHPAVASFLLHSIVVVAMALVAHISRAKIGTSQKNMASQRATQSVSWLALSSAASASLIIPWLVDISGGDFAVRLSYATGTAISWGIAAWLCRVPLLYSGFQLIVTLNAFLATATICQQFAWWTGNLTHPWHISAQVGVLAISSVLWSVARRRIDSHLTVGVDVSGRRGLVEECLLLAAIAGAVCAPLWGTAQGMMVELGVSSAFQSASSWPGALFGVATWAAWVITLLAVVVRARLHDGVWRQASVALGAAGPILIVAATYAPLGVSASIVRWGAAITALTLTLLYVVQRIYQQEPTVRRTGNWLMLLSSIVVGISLCHATLQVSGFSLNNVNGSTQAALGQVAHHAGAMLLIAGSLAAFSCLVRSPGFASAATLVIHVAINLTLVLVRSESGQLVTTTTVADVLQWNAIGLSLSMMFWDVLKRATTTVRRERPTSSFEVPVINLDGLAAATGASLLGLGLLSAISVSLQPFTNGFNFTPSIAWLSCAAFSLTIVGLMICQPRWAINRVRLTLVTAWIAPPILAITVNSYHSPTDVWLAFHILEIGWLLFAGLACGYSHVAFRNQTARTSADASILCGISLAIVFVLAIASTLIDTWSPWWPPAVAAVTSLLFAWLAVNNRSILVAYGATGVWMVSSTLLWVNHGGLGRPDHVFELTRWSLIALASAGVLWSCLRLYGQHQGKQLFARESLWLPERMFPSVVVLALGASQLLVALADLSVRLPRVTNASFLDDWQTSLVFVVIGVLLALGLWIRGTRHVLPGFYLWGLSGIFAVVAHVELSTRFSITAVVIAIGMYTALTGRAWSIISPLHRRIGQLGIVDILERFSLAERWLPAVNLVIGLPTTLLAAVIVLTFPEREPRYLACFVPALLAFGLMAFATSRFVRRLSLVLIAISGILIHWADLTPEWTMSMSLVRSIRALMALSVTTFLYAMLARWLMGLGSNWREELRWSALGTGCAAFSVLATTLAIELLLFEPGVGLPVAAVYSGAVAVMLVLLTIGLLVLALRTVENNLSDSIRMALVYGSELVIGLLALHIYLVNPQLFGGVFRAYWPYVTVGLAFFGVGASELFRRQAIHVLAEPLGRTGLFLPLLPAIACWFQAPEFGQYSLVLLSTGLLYLTASSLRASPICVTLAAVAGNLALWAWLNEQSVAFYMHPQVWIIPPAACVLAAAQWNRERLSETQLTSLRYATMILIYISSTSEILLAGIGESLWPPIILTVLSVAGVLAGIVMRIRAFVYLGASFVLVSMVSMVWHASQRLGHVWPWWAFGVAMGLAILAIFVYFEKRRSNLSHTVRQAKTSS